MPEAPAQEKLSPEDLAAEVRRLQEEGFSSLKISAKLKISLREVNKYWDPEIASEQGREEQENEAV